MSEKFNWKRWGNDCSKNRRKSYYLKKKKRNEVGKWGKLEGNKIRLSKFEVKDIFLTKCQLNCQIELPLVEIFLPNSLQIKKKCPNYQFTQFKFNKAHSWTKYDNSKTHKFIINIDK